MRKLSLKNYISESVKSAIKKEKNDIKRKKKSAKNNYIDRICSNNNFYENKKFTCCDIFR